MVLRKNFRNYQKSKKKTTQKKSAYGVYGVSAFFAVLFRD
jgi:hypothetical protein